MIDRRKFLGLPLLGAPLLFVRNAFAQESAINVRRPVAVSTWDSGITANNAAWPILLKGGRALEAVEAAGRASEADPSCCVGLAVAGSRWQRDA